MKRILAIATLLLATFPACAEQILFESGTLGQTGITEEQLTSQEVPGTNINEFVYVGVRFEFSQPVVISRVGGHFSASDGGGGTFFGAIVSLDGTDDFPDSGDLSTPDVFGDTLLTFPDPSSEIFGELSLTLAPGDYALVFGSGLFGATGGGGQLTTIPISGRRSTSLFSQDLDGSI